MIIGISGRIGSGKDTVGKIIQYLTYDKQMLGSRNYFYPTDVFLEELKNNPRLFENEAAPFQIKKFADKLKDIVCLLIGCTREHLEDREFKEKELGPEWDRIITSDGEIHLPDDYPDLKYSKLTPRLLLQIIGTDCIRDKVHPNAWVNGLFSDYKAKWVPTGDSVAEEDVSLEKEYPNWIITDMRFPNELEAVKDRGGVTIRVNRPKNDLDNHKDCVKTEDGYCIQSENNYCKGSCKYEHPSEASLDSATFDFVISNDKDIEHLINEVRKILEKLSII